MKAKHNLIILFIIFAACACISLYGQSYSVPSPISAYDVAVWTYRGAFIASGSATPTGTASEGALYADVTIATQPTLFRYSGSAWQPISGGTRKHSELEELAFADSGHTGFASEAAIPNNASFTLSGLSEKDFANLTGKPTNASYTLSGLSEKDFSSLTGKPTNSSYTLSGLSEKDFSSLDNTPTTLSGYGITDAATDASLTADVASLADHIADNYDPHGATMTISETLTVGVGSPTVTIDNPSEGVARVASYAQLVSVSAAPTSALASDVITFWGDSASDTLMIHNGNSWQNLGGSYAELHAHDNSTGQSIATGTTYAKITALIGAGPYNDAAISTSTQEITINRAGTYRVALNVSFYSDTDNVIAYFAAFKGTSELDNIRFERKIGTGADVGSSAASGYVTCAAGDKITLRARHDYTAAVTLTVTYANLNVERIGN